MDSLIRMDNLSFRYANSRELALRNISLEIKRGEFILVLGKSGCGKSTLGRCLNGLIPHLFGGELEGEVVVCEKNTRECSIAELSRYIGLVFQNPDSQLLALDIENEVAFAPENFCLPKEVIKKRVDWSLERVGMHNLRTKSVYGLSDGQKQRVAIAASLSLLPEILVLDEPTSNLDEEAAEEFFKLLQSLKREGKTIVLIEHRTKYAAKYATRAVIMEEGKIEYDGKPEPVFEEQIQRRFGIRKPDWQKPPQNYVIPRKASQPLIKISDFRYSYGDGFKLEIGSLTFYKSESIGIMGPNGCGKSTLIKNIVGLLRPLEGKIFLAGVDSQKLKVSEIAGRIGLILQNSDHQLFMSSVYDEVAFGLELNGNHNDNREKVKEILKMMGLWEVRNRHPHSLSEGQKQRTALAAVLAREPDVLILDEPTTGMDGHHMDLLIGKLNELKGKGLTLIIVSHDEEMISKISDRIVVLSDATGRQEME